MFFFFDVERLLISYHLLTAYTKLANILFTTELQRRFNAEKFPIIAIAVQPGYVLSGMFSYQPCEKVRNPINPLSEPPEGNVDLFSSLYFGTLLVWLAKLWFVTSRVGAYTSAFAAASPKVRENEDKYKGKYIVPYGKLEETSKDAMREDLAKELWKTSEDVLVSLV
jgi:hypothetical protein